MLIADSSIAYISGAHDLPRVIDAVRLACLASEGPEVLHPAPGLPQKGARGQKAGIGGVVGRSFPHDLAGVIDAMSLALLTPERADVLHPLSGLP